ncbi:hypothetical protein Y032_0143g2422 [Ancylostoma ceylanicum]|uniref:Uncharacterized protein n=1 Tax=Ancylostoma ceylanicum TaxID=53326 RepID=A0A016T3K0_9BILA|nr:hypothetical protein Y032_0143g2422 [Ancylostoma ceylanicum]
MVVSIVIDRLVIGVLARRCQEFIVSSNIHTIEREKIGQTYYVSDPRHPHQYPEAIDEESGDANENRATPRLRAGRDDEPYCIRCTILIFFIAVVLIAAYLFRISRLHEFKFELFDAMALAVVIVAVIGAIATFYKNPFLLGLISFILVGLFL